MSEFECRYGHLTQFGQDCKECERAGRFGERTYYMDGMSASAWRKREQWEEEQAQREEED
jgi:hypothetical protein